MQSPNDQIAHGLNICDRVEILSNIVMGRTDEIDLTLMEQLMEPYYPAFHKFCHAVLEEKKPIFQIDAIVHDAVITFVTSYEDGSVKDYTYEDRDPFFPAEADSN